MPRPPGARLPAASLAFGMTCTAIPRHARTPICGRDGSSVALAEDVRKVRQAALMTRPWRRRKVPIASAEMELF